jgi:hypothetical protein
LIARKKEGTYGSGVGGKDFRDCQNTKEEGKML